MNFLNPLLAGLQLLRFNFTNDNQQSQNFFSLKEGSNDEKTDNPQIKAEDFLKLQAFTQQEIIKRQFLENYVIFSSNKKHQKILKQQQQQLALQLKSNQEQKVELQTVNQEEKSSTEEKPQEKKDLTSKKIKKQNTCGHPDKEHYAKGMCNNCYHRLGRSKQPWLCNHTKLYACGLCQNCYINKYNRKRRQDGQVEISKSQ